jgi:hypothetical protein
MNMIVKALVFAFYIAGLALVLSGLKEILVAYTDFTAWITPTICYFFTRLQVDLLISSSIALASANWLKSKITNYWTNA